MTFRDWVLLVSVGVNVLSVAATLYTWRRSQEAQRVQAQMERFFLFEARLADWTEAFAFYDIDLETARRSGVTEKQIAYLVLAINALMADFRAQPGRRGWLGRSRSLRQFVAASTYWSHLLAQPRTADVWRFARNCISEPARTELTAFIERHAAPTASGANGTSGAHSGEENRNRSSGR